jgi:hypothetical protein
MKTRSNLHFLLALGNTKVVVLKEKDNLQIYSGKRNENRYSSIKPERLAEAFSSR